MDNVIGSLLFIMQKCKKALGSHFSPVTWSVPTTPVSFLREYNTLMPIALPSHLEHSPLPAEDRKSGSLPPFIQISNKTAAL